MQTHPGAVGLRHIAECLRELKQPRLDGLAVPESGAVLDVNPVSRGVLTDHQQFLDTTLQQSLRFPKHITNRTRHQIAAH